MYHKIKIMIFFAGIFMQKIHAQDSSPYSYFGIGTFNNVDNARNISLGNTGIALESPDYINSKNPASLTSIGIQNVIFDVGGFLKSNSISSNQGADKRINGNFTNLGLAMRISNKFFLSANVQPTTSTDYQFDSKIPIEGTSSNYPITYEGSGGISNLGVGLGYRINNNWSVGGKIKNNFGTIIRKEIITTTTELEISRNIRYTGFSYGLGTQYNKYFQKERLQLTLGAIVNFKSNLNAKGETIYTEDRDYNNSLTTKLSSKDSTLPLEVGLGVSVLKNDRYRFSFDYTQSDWNEVKNTVTTEKYYRQRVYGLGFELLPERKTSQIFSENLVYRFGLNYDTGYYKVNNRNINKMEATVGVGIPMNKINLNVGYGYGKRGLLNNSAIKENYHMLNISVDFLDKWFAKRYLN
ncbi:Long-chain fatty acid transport protein [Epilithonimonas hungarica]|uniref:Long-chain fatty acid transport protein n=2 Tax=Epilithonimonas hungarica TaxID=454006 RepID=A0A1G7GFB8_9FLAO|nr:Long-chain fatty acid transport protein [Epilithonimonas hungarica]